MSTDTGVLGQLLAVENSVVYGVDSAGGMAAAAGAGAPVLALLHSVAQAHRAARDNLTVLLAARHAPVPTAAPGYSVPALITVSTVLGFVAGLEDHCSFVYRDAVSVLIAAQLRGMATGAVIAAAEHAYLLRTAAGTAAPAAMQAFPGG